MNVQPLSTATALQATRILGLLGELNSRLEKEAAISLLHCREQEELDIKLVLSDNPRGTSVSRCRSASIYGGIRLSSHARSRGCFG